ncbi:MAG TPA: TadE/TadG family type IV pilus assembly protein [Bacillota bacterium]|nr:TadE/TadG family type IV pilus assembly protein [Bacillota bacterium]
MSRFKKIIEDRRGQALVELALILPLLILLLMGTIEFGRIFHSYLIITNASREGARAGIIGKTDTEIRTLVKEVTASLEIPDSQISITPEQSSRTRGVPITVSVNYSVNLITPLLQTFATNPFPIKAATTMRVE